eukprot:CAMPEP_0114669564 /NCGR_PEP_ID=MMETSP0191-20121206/38258_1 /TAXON_ID=126664 /ORGANISM="Sorites sp." /LENGTH=146 /DNA_ID=CAMNT_0001925481 /DNA_START=127 /DNA_END=567 /DNA_ORIENTATION=+
MIKSPGFVKKVELQRMESTTKTENDGSIATSQHDSVNMDSMIEGYNKTKTTDSPFPDTPTTPTTQFGNNKSNASGFSSDFGAQSIQLEQIQDGKSSAVFFPTKDGNTGNPKFIQLQQVASLSTNIDSANSSSPPLTPQPTNVSDNE